MSISEDPHSWRGALVHNTEGVVLGHVDGVHFGGAGGRATWMGISDGAGVATVPLDGTTLDGQGLLLPYTVAQLADAPRHDLRRPLDSQTEQVLYRYYGLAPGGNPDTARRHDADAAPTGAVDAAAGAPGGAAEMLRSQEQLRVGVQRRVYGRARLVTYIVTEDMTFTVPVSRQEVRLEPVSLDETDHSGSAPLGGQLVEDVHEIVLHREQVSFTTTVVPNERVRLVRRIITEQQEITTRLRHEEIDLNRSGGSVENDVATPVYGTVVPTS